MASQHSAEFRQEALRIALTIGLNRKQVVADFDVEPLDTSLVQRSDRTDDP